MTNTDPNRRWDGQQWLTWNGASWRPDTATTSLPARPTWYGQHPPASSQSGLYGQPSAPQPTPWVQPYRPVYGQPFATDGRDRTAMAVIAWILTVLTLLYFLPWAIAATRGKSNAGMVGLVNFLIGWTFIGWIVALVMACGAHQIRPAPTINIYGPGASGQWGS